MIPSMSGKSIRVVKTRKALAGAGVGFWAPPLGDGAGVGTGEAEKRGLGGKVRGYAYGWEGSREGGRDEGEGGYRRDKMRKGRMAV